MTSNTKKILLIGAFVAALALGVAIFTSVTPVSAQSGWQGEGEGAPAFGNYQEALAEALGITVEELQDAYQTAHQAAIQQALDDGKITQEQAERMLAAGSDRPFGRDGRFGFGGQADEFLADALGISVEDLQAAKEAAHAAVLEQALADGTITQEQIDMMNARNVVAPYFQEAMQTAYQSAIEQALADGVITQEQADQLLLNAEEGLGHGPAGRPPFGGRGPHPGR
ncbi:MAG: hypothetical protein JXB38_21665 [Anaerolineales bacterium]|nr:hypothetical protein [Anaerolineales bacterium]